MALTISNNNKAIIYTNSSYRFIIAIFSNLRNSKENTSKILKQLKSL